jgi:ubiquinone/menaquinone biosynthesis C-methylase UbiE
MSESDNEVDFWNEEARKTRRIIQRASRESLLKDVLAYNYWWEESLSKMENKIMLDIGCGTTDHTAYWELSGNEAYGIDISPEQIRNETIIHKKLGINGRFVVSSAANISFRDNCFDVLSMHWLLHHIPQTLLNKSMQDAHRILKKNGLFLLYENNYFYPFRWIVQTNLLRKVNFLRRVAIKKRVLDPEERALSFRDYVKLLEDNGFRIIKANFSKHFLWHPPALFFPNRRLLQAMSKIDILITHIIPNVLKDDISIIARK